MSIGPLQAQPHPLSADEVVIGGQVGTFQHGTYPSFGDKTHPGVDVIADCGSSVNAWQGGMVIDMISDVNDRNFSSLGYMVMIDHGTLAAQSKRTFSLYLHLAEPPKLDGRSKLEIGTKVKRGSRIGKVGSTGVATGCHLHFETRHFASRFHPDWLNIYGNGDKRRAPEFLSDWTDPKVATFGNNKPAQISAAVSAKAQTPAAGQRLSSIPTEFQGKWRENPAQCDDMTETGLDISAKSLKYYGFTPAMTSIRSAGPRTILVTQTVQRDELGGTIYSQDQTTTYELSADGRSLIETDTFGYRISRVSCADNGAQTVAPRPAPNQEVKVWVTAPANVRSHPTTAGSQILAKLDAGGLMTGAWVNGDDGSSRWLRVDLAAMELYSPLSPFGYIWEGNLRLAEKEQTDTSKGQTQRAVVTDGTSSSLLPQLRIGAYVSFPTRCAKASNATLEWWNGQFFSGGRKHPAYPRAAGPARPNGSQPFVADVKGWEENKTYRVNFLVLSQSMYERDGLRYFHCSENRLPSAWRGVTPPQTMP